MSWLRSSCEFVDIPFQRNVNLVLDNEENLSNLVPSTTYRISKDGNCLFGSLSTLLSGSERHQSTVRKLICDEMSSTSPITNEQINLFSDRLSFSWTEYLEKHKMRNDGVWGGDLEVAVFCHLFKVELIVYVLSLQQWIIYLKNSFTDRRNLFLINWGNHWEPIASLRLKNSNETLFITNISLTENIQTTRPDRKRRLVFADDIFVGKKTTTFDQPQRMPKFFCGKEFVHSSANCFHKNVKLGSQATNASIDLDTFQHIKVHDFVTCRRCQKCQRVSTQYYPLEFKTISSSSAIKRQYGEPLHVGDSEVCVECYSYITEKKTSWNNAWPSVLYSLCFGAQKPEFVSLFLKLPIQIRASWLFHAVKIKGCLMPSSLFQDITRDIVEYNRRIKTYLVSDFKSAMENFSLPSVECFCGASEFIDSAGSLPFCHLLNFVDESFTLFRANWRDNICSIRSDYLDKRDKYVVFRFAPSVIVSAKGLCLSTCELHSHGSKKKIVHVPNHPVVGNLCHASADRLAPLVPSLRGAKPTKLGEFSNTFTMSKSVGGPTGVGSITLHSHRNLNVDSSFLLPGLESTFLQNRPDMTENLTSIASEYNLSKEFCTGLMSPKMCNERQMEQSLKAATYIPMTTIQKLKKQNDEADEETFVNLKTNVIHNNFDSSGVLPPLPRHKLLNKFYFLSMLVLLFNTIYECGNSLIDKASSACQQLRKVIAKPTETEFKKLRDLLKIPSNATVAKCWSFAEQSIEGVQVIHGFDNFSSLSENTETCVILFRRPQSIFLDSIQVPETFQISAVERSPERNIFNFQMFRTHPRSSTVLCDLSTPKILASNGIIFDIEYQNLRAVILTRKTKVPFGLINLFSGQYDVSCPVHDLPLCCDYKDSGFCCSVEKCKRLSKWRCPQKLCKVATCEKHLHQVKSTASWPILRRFEEYIDAESDDDDSSILQTEVEAYDEIIAPLDNFDDVQFLGPSCADNLTGETLDTDAGQEFLPVETKERSDLEFLPIQLLFNVYLSVLNRPKSPVKGNLRFRRFMQSFVARNAKTSISLLQPESLLFPSIFYKQSNDGSTPGALPFFLYGSDSKCASYGFAGLLEHFRTRITDVSLLTTANHQYIQFAVDCLMNLQLKSMHSKVFFQRGLQSLKLYNEESRLFSKSVTAITNDTEKCVRQLSSAIASMPVTLFLTITCNQRQHPATRQLWEAIGEFYSECSDEIKRAAFCTYMTTMVRCWSRSVKYLFDLFLNSPELIVGKVVKIWGRAEFQTTAGNLPHYHILLWVEPGSYNIDELIQCSEKSILQSLNDICHSTLNLIRPDQVFTVFQNMTRIHTHSCEKSGYRCQKRKDLEGNVICRTPPQPQSHCHWKLKIQQQYSEDALSLLEKLNLAEVNEFGVMDVSGPLICEKYMYAAETGEHILPTSSKLFALTESSVNLLRTTPRFSSSYLSSYAGKSEEHADATIRSAPDGKSFRLRDDGIQNKSLASVKFELEHEKDNSRSVEAVRCQLLAITESIFLVLGEPYVLTNMKFKHVQNVPVEKRFVQTTAKRRYNLETFNFLTFRDYVSSLPDWRKVTDSQQILVSDLRETNESIDNMSQFSLRPPELLCIRNVKCYTQWFSVSKNLNSAAELVELYQAGAPAPFVNCQGSTVKVHPKAIPMITEYLETNFNRFNQYNLQRSSYVQNYLRDCPDLFIVDVDLNGPLLPEIVFRSIPPLDALDFLISFVLRFGEFETELDLFNNTDLLCCYQSAGLVPLRSNYTEADLYLLLNKYVRDELIFLPGGVLTFTAKLFSAKSAFSRLLNINSSELETFSCPTVLIESLHSEVETAVNEYIEATQDGMYRRILGLGLPNLPGDPLNTNRYWEPELPIMQGQLMASFLEQQRVLRKIANALIRKFSSSDSASVNHQIIMGRPGTGKTHLTGVVLAQALCNGLVSYLTSLPSRRSIQLFGEHIHRLFKISTRNLDAASLCSEALVRLNHDHKRRVLLTKLQVLLVEEMSLINAETWSAMDLIMQNLKDNASSFGGVLVVANGDCCQLPNINGYNIFEACSFLFNFDFHFLEEFVRMEDPVGQELLKLLEERPVEEENINRIIGIISEQCNFVSNWQELTDRLIMRVFGKKVAEQEAFDKHCAFVESTEMNFSYSMSIDEISTEGTHFWRPAGRKVSNQLNKQVTEYEKVLFYPNCIMRATQNLDGIQQGQLCILDFNSVTNNTISVYVAPAIEAVNEDCLNNGDFLFWRKITLRKTAGYVQNYRRSSIRRIQFPVINYVALTVHRLMGDTFLKLATEISSVEKKFTLWLISQLYVIISRVKYLIQLFFIGNKEETLTAVRDILMKRDLREERLFKLFLQLRRAAIQNTPGVIEGPCYLRSHFEVPKTANGYVFVLVSVRTMTFQKFYAGETSEGLSEFLRRLNSTDERNSRMIRAHQPWAVGFFYWNFNHEDERIYACQTIERILENNDNSYQVLLNHCNFALRHMSHIKACVCGRVVQMSRNVTADDSDSGD